MASWAHCSAHPWLSQPELSCVWPCAKSVRPHSRELSNLPASAACLASPQVAEVDAEVNEMAELKKPLCVSDFVARTKNTRNTEHPNICEQQVQVLDILGGFVANSSCTFFRVLCNCPLWGVAIGCQSASPAPRAALRGSHLRRPQADR